MKRYSDRWVNRLTRSLAQFVVDGVCGRVAGDFRKYHQTADATLKNLELYRQSAGDVKTIFILPPAFDTRDKSGPELTNESREVRQQLLKLRDRLGNCFELPNIDLSYAKITPMPNRLNKPLLETIAQSINLPYVDEAIPLRPRNTIILESGEEVQIPSISAQDVL